MLHKPTPIRPTCVCVSLNCMLSYNIVHFPYIHSSEFTQKSKSNYMFWQYNFIWLIITSTDIITRTKRRSLHMGAHDDKRKLRWMAPDLIRSSFPSCEMTNRWWVSTVSMATKSYHPHPLHLLDIFLTACFMWVFYDFQAVFFPFQRGKKQEHDSPALWQLHQILTGISIVGDLKGESPWQWGRKWKQAAFQMMPSFLMWMELWQKRKPDQLCNYKHKESNPQLNCFHRVLFMEKYHFSQKIPSSAYQVSPIKLILIFLLDEMASCSHSVLLTALYQVKWLTYWSLVWYGRQL